MADYYLRQFGYPTYTAVPTGASWPLNAQDGDGYGPDLAVSAVASIDFAGVTAAATNTLSVMGALLTCVASGAIANQFNAGSAATLATNVAASINAATNPVTSAVSAAVPQLRNLLYARVHPTTTTMVQIMTRVGSATLNHAGNTSVAITSAGLTGTPSVVNFAGGVSGAWGYLWNGKPLGTNYVGTIWPSAVAQNAYGCAFVATANRPLVGPVLTHLDTVHVRGDGQGLSSGNGSTGLAISITAQINLLVDDGTVWAGQNNGFDFRHENTSSNQVWTVNAAAASGTLRPICLEARQPGKLRFRYAPVGVNTTGAMSVQVSSSSLLLTNTSFFDDATAAGATGISVSLGSNGQLALEGCSFTFSRNVFTPVLSGGNTGASNKVQFSNCTFTWTSLASAAGALVSIPAYGSPSILLMTNCKAIGATPRAVVYSGLAPSSHYITLTNLAGFDLPNTLLGLMGASSAVAPDDVFCVAQNIGNNNGYRIETVYSVVDWNPAGGYPTLYSQLQNGMYWSHRLILSAAENAARHGGTNELLQLNKTVEVVDAVATLTLEMLIPTAQAAGIFNEHFGLNVAYTTTDGTTQFETLGVTPRALPGTAMSGSSALWTLNSYAGYTAKKLVLTTSLPVKQNSIIEVGLTQRRPMPAQVEIFLDPDMVIT